MRNLRNNKGFTLIELMIVVVIIGILAAIAIPKFSSVSKGAKEAEAPPVLKQIRSLQASYYQKNDAYAPNLATLTGWSDPNAKYYTFTTNNAGCALGSPSTAGTAAGVAAQSLTQDGAVGTTC